MHGGVKFYRGSAAAARSYVEADHSRADDYYLAEGSGLAEHYLAGPGAVRRVGDLDGPAYERWVGGYDVLTDTAKGRLRDDARALRFVEVVVNGPKSWSLAAALHPDIAAAYDAAMGRAASEVIGWVADHATTRVGPRGRQVQVPVEMIEAAVVRHYTSRAGDPHRHLHVQINARVFARGAWRGLHSVGVVDSIEALNGIGHAAVMCDPEFRAALAARGYSLDEDGEIQQLAPYSGRFSQRAAQINRNVDRYEAAWRAEHPGQEPGPRLRRTWDRRAWADARPDKVVPKDGGDLVTRWNEELHDLGFCAPAPPAAEPCLKDLETLKRRAPAIGAINRDVAVELILLRLDAKRSAWNAADIRGEAERLIASAGVVAERPVRRELVEDVADRAVARCVPLLDRDDVPEHVRSLTSERVLAVEADLVDSIASRSTRPVTDAVRLRGVAHLDPAQQRVVAALAGDACDAGLIVIEGAAGTGKTTTLAAARDVLDDADRRLVVVTPTLKAAQAAQQQVGTAAFSAAWLIHQHGYRWDEDGHWSQTEAAPEARARLPPGDVLLVDEAGMLDQDTARALFAIADRAHAVVALLGDRHQLPAVGRGGVLDLAARWVRPEGHHELESVHRFRDPAYADLSLLMRTGERSGEVFDALLERGEVVVHATEVERTAALAMIGAEGDQLVITDTREQVGTLNSAIRDRRHGEPGERTGELTTRRGEQIALGDRVATRRNDRNLEVANRDTWTVAGVGDDASLFVTGRAGQRTLPAAYVSDHVELAFTTTAYGAQGETVDSAHLALGETTGAASAYVGMTRGRHRNVAHLVAETVDDARSQWVDIFNRDRADLGPTHAAERAADDIDRYGPNVGPPALGLQAAVLRDGPRRPPPPIPAPRPSSRGVGR
ncbi:relaxase domain-containing protein [Nocardioides sp. dk4132]|uniref:MobF family relaxase n=1 Tax=unclassified Nocardioides TaxID=2615069 RepID=UPI0012973A25|nr:MULTISPECIES: MobF family relaxase [unclassified Nocardioides]MQW77078.1 relaxase domain-containing protein [Nocardioides sp. dk4132]QGA05972.1 relaxase domain-containing protein [Nocardioides sp. dk884]